MSWFDDDGDGALRRFRGLKKAREALKTDETTRSTRAIPEKAEGFAFQSGELTVRQQIRRERRELWKRAGDVLPSGFLPWDRTSRRSRDKHADQDPEQTQRQPVTRLDGGRRTSRPSLTEDDDRADLRHHHREAELATQKRDPIYALRGADARYAQAWQPGARASTVRLEDKPTTPERRITSHPVGRFDPPENA